MKFRFGSVLALALALLVQPIAFAQSAPQYKELPNFGQVDEHLYRGAQPRSGGIEKLASLGIKTIIDLRGASSRSRQEERQAKASGLNYHNIPMPGWGRPTNEQVARVMAIIDEPENQPVFVHCRRGSDRTGVIVACYRISHDDWKEDQVRAEASKYGMAWYQFWIKDYASDYYRACEARKKEDSEAADKGFAPKSDDFGDKIGHGFTLLERAARKGETALVSLFHKTAHSESN